MSKNQLVYNIQKELVVLNDRIDRNIIKGRSYSKEALRHKMLLRQLGYVAVGRARPRRTASLLSFLA